MKAPVTYDLTFQPFPKMARLSRECIVTEKIDGTNAQIYIVPAEEFHRLALIDSVPSPAAHVREFVIIAGSRTRWIRPKNPGEKGDPDNYGFAAWVRDNAAELVKLGPGKHFGEWYGSGINRAYGMTNGERRFALFNVSRWFPNVDRPGVSRYDESTDIRMLVAGPACCYVVPTIWRGNFDTRDTDNFIEMLRSHGSFAVPGFMRPEGIVIYHTAANTLFKKTLDNDEAPKGVPDLTDQAQLARGREAADEAFRQKLEMMPG